MGGDSSCGKIASEENSRPVHMGSHGQLGAVAWEAESFMCKKRWSYVRRHFLACLSRSMRLLQESQKWQESQVNHPVAVAFLTVSQRDGNLFAN